MYVYRVEHKDPKMNGPYTSGIAFSPRLYDEDHPAPYEEGIVMTPEDYSCFTSKEALTKWFRSSELTMFREFGYDTYRYEVNINDVQFGQKQAAFKKGKAYKRQKVTVH